VVCKLQTFTGWLSARFSWDSEQHDYRDLSWLRFGTPTSSTWLPAMCAEPWSWKHGRSLRLASTVSCLPYCRLGYNLGRVLSNPLVFLQTRTPLESTRIEVQDSFRDYWFLLISTSLHTSLVNTARRYGKCNSRPGRCTFRVVTWLPGRASKDPQWTWKLHKFFICAFCGWIFPAKNRS